MRHKLDMVRDAETVKLVIKSSTTNRPVPGLGYVTMYTVDTTGQSETMEVWTR